MIIYVRFNLVSGIELFEMIKYEFFTCFISFCDQINLCIMQKNVNDSK